MTTLTQFRSRIQLKVGGKSNINSTIDTNINEAIVQFIMEIKPQEMWEEVTLVPSNATAEYPFASSIWGAGADTALSDLLAIIMVRDETDDVEIKRGGARDYNRSSQDTSDSSTLGDPRSWTRIGNSLVLYNRIPDSTTRSLTVTYLKRPTALSDDADTFPLNREWERPVSMLATAMTWQDLNAYDKSAAAMQAYRDLLVNMDKPENIEDEAPEAQVIFTSNLVQ